MNFFILDERLVWFKAAMEAAVAFGYTPRRIYSGMEVAGLEGLGFIRPHAEPAALRRNHRDFELMANQLVMIQDQAQMDVYENKSAQFARWGTWMPETFRFTDRGQALHFVAQAPYRLVSKADEGASSVNVRVFENAMDATRHVMDVFDHGVTVNHCSGGATSVQKGYVLLQQFIPHEVTWRVNAIGNGRSVFRRFNYPHRSVAQTGNVEPVREITPQVESLLEYADAFFNAAGTRWCALDILWDAESMEWKLLETSLAWPWPSPGDCNAGPIFLTQYKWIDMFAAMFSEVEKGAWAYSPARVGEAA